MTTHTAINWETAQTLVHDASGIDNPAEWYWEETNGVYYPTISIED